MAMVTDPQFALSARPDSMRELHRHQAPCVSPPSHTGIHHHGEQQTIAYVLSGICEVRWGARGEYDARAKAGDFIHVPAFLPHMEINRSDSEPFHWVVVRSTSTPIVVNLPDHTWPQPRHALAAGLPSLSS